MALLEVIFGVRKTEISSLVLDAAYTIEYAFTNQITQFGVELGSVSADHIQHNPEVVTINGEITQTPTVFGASIFAPSPFKDDPTRVTDRVEKAFTFLRGLAQGDELISISTPRGEFDNMGVVSFTVNEENYNAMPFTMVLQHVPVVQTEQVDAPAPKNPANAKPVDRGSQPKTAASPTTSSSVLSRLTGAF